MEVECTAAGTTLVTDLQPGSASSTVFGPGLFFPFPTFVEFNGALHFVADDGVHGSEIWKSNGTAVGTIMVTDSFPDGGVNPFSLSSVNGTWFFAAFDATHGPELWKTDGTGPGTQMVEDINPGTSGPPFLQLPPS